MRRYRLSAFLVTALIAHFACAAELSEAVKFDIQPQALETALLEFSKQSGIQIFGPAQGVTGKKSPAIQGEQVVEEALKALLEGTGLIFRQVNERTVAIGPREEKTAQKAPEVTAIHLADAPESQLETPAGVQGGIRGRVLAAGANKALAGAFIVILETGQTAITDDDGRFTFANLPAGMYTLSIAFIGYADKLWRVGPTGEPAVRDFVLDQSAWDIAEVTVFGTRSARANALSQQRAAENSSFVISSDTLGNFSGTTIAEALRRAPGVAFERDGVTGDGTNVILRGLAPDFNGVQLNGLNLPTSRGYGGMGRAPSLGNLLADSVDKITINHSLLPSMDSAGSGGLIEIETKSPLQREHRFVSFGAETGRTANADFQNDLLINGTVSGTFGEARNFGLSASVQYRDREVSNLAYDVQLLMGQYLPLALDGTTSVTGLNQIDPRVTFPFEPGVDQALPWRSTFSSRHAKTSTLAVTLGGEWQASESTNLRLDVTRSDSDSQSFFRNAVAEAEVGYFERPVKALGGERRQALGFTGGIGTNADYFVTDSRDMTDTYSFRISSDLGKWQHTATLGYVAGDSSTPRDFSFITLAKPRTDFVDFNDPRYTLPSAIDPVEERILSPFGERRGKKLQLPLLTQAGFDYFNDVTSHDIIIGGLSDTTSFNGRYTGELTTRYSFDAPHMKYVEIGANFERSDFDYHILYSGFDTGRVVCETPDPDSCTLVPFTMTDLGLRFADVDLSAIGIPRGQGFQYIEERQLRNLFDQVIAGKHPLLGLLPGVQDPRAALARTSEDNLASYIQARVDFGRLQIIGGARMARVAVDARNLLTPTIIAENGAIDEVAQRRLTTLVDESGTVTDVLPRIQLNYRLTENLIFRGSYSLAVARPTIRDLSGEKSILFSRAPGYAADPTRPALVINEGNPELDPAVTHSFDLSAEYYSNQIGLMRLTLFYKHINNLLETNTRSEVPLDSVALDLPDDEAFDDLPENLFIAVNRPVNNPLASKVWGFEGHLERQFTSLPGLWSGFGVFGNFTYSKSSKHAEYSWFNPYRGVVEDFEFNHVAFDQSPRYTGTLALTYNLRDIDATLTYSKQARRPQTFGFRDHGLSYYSGAYDSLDLHAERRFKLWGLDNRVYLEVQDLLKGSRDPDLLNSLGSDATPNYTIGGSYLGGRLMRVGVNTTF